MSEEKKLDYFNKENIIVIDKDIQKNFTFKNADLKMVTNYHAIIQSIKNILYTKKGELVGLNDFGSSIHNYLFEQLTENKILELKEQIINEIEIFEPRVKIIDFEYKFNNPPGTLKLSIIFKIKSLPEREIFKEDFLINNSFYI